MNRSRPAIRRARGEGLSFVLHLDQSLPLEMEQIVSEQAARPLGARVFAEPPRRYVDRKGEY